MNESTISSRTKLGGIAFNKVMVGKRRIVKFKVTNPGPNDFTVSKIYISQLGPAQPGRSPTPQSFGMSNQTFAVSSTGYASPIKVFRVYHCPPLPFVVPPYQETELSISFTPNADGFFSALLEIVPYAPQPCQQITLHGEGEFPSSPQQILYNNNPSSISFNDVSAHNSGGDSFVVSRVAFDAKDEDIYDTNNRTQNTFIADATQSRVKQTDWYTVPTIVEPSPFVITPTSSRYNPTISRSPMSPSRPSIPTPARVNYTPSSPLASSLRSSQQMDSVTIRNTVENSHTSSTKAGSPSSPVVVELENRVSKLEQLLVNLMHEKTSSKDKEMLSPVKKIHFEDEQEPSLDISYNSAVSAEDNKRGWSEEDHSFYKKIASPAQTPGPPGWRDFIKGAKTEAYSPTLTRMANTYDKTPLVNKMYREPDFESSFWRHSPSRTPGPNKSH